MKKVLVFVIFIVLVIGAALIFDKPLKVRDLGSVGGESMPEKDSNKEGQAPSEVEGQVREPVVAGTFYPAGKVELSSILDEYLSEIESPIVEKYVRGLIVPHAGYQFSGWVAAYGYKTLIGQDIDTVILIGPSHHEYFEGVSVYPEGFYKTPLGNVEIDKNLAKKIIDSHEKISFRESAHLQEHSLEVQLPFLQRVFSASGQPHAGWKIVPIVIGNQPGANEILINTLKDLVDENTLLIASSDLSHYPKYEDAKYSDNKVIEAILTGKRENLQKTVSQLEKENIYNLQTCACGQDSIEVIMGLMEDKEAKLLKYANSGDVDIGDKDRVVGYAAIVFTIDKLEGELGMAEQKRLLEIARETVETYVKTKKLPKFSNDYPALEKHLGAFVTIKKQGQLRGCIGLFSVQGGPASGGQSLYQVVSEMALAAATKDNRFRPVTEDELKDLEYEISVLSPLRKVDIWEEIKIGKHGVQIKKGLRTGVFLPQVATDNNWDLDTFMGALCTQKAGLSADCWKDPETDIYVFTAQVF